MDNIGFSNQEIINYYDQTEINFRQFWNLTKGLSLHYGFWDQNTRSLSEAQNNTNRIISELGGILKEDIVLDAGCGVGGSAIYFAKNVGCRVKGITLSDRQIEFAANNAKKYRMDHLVNFEKQDFTQTHYGDHTFDVIVAIESVCHTLKKSEFLREAFRILKKGGKLIVADCFKREHALSKEETEIYHKFIRGWIIWELDTLEEFKKNMRGAGFEKIEDKNMTKNIMPSSLRMFRYSYLGFFLNSLSALIGTLNPYIRDNVVSAHNQYHAFRRRICSYDIISARK